MSSWGKAHGRSRNDGDDDDDNNHNGDGNRARARAPLFVYSFSIILLEDIVRLDVCVCPVVLSSRMSSDRWFRTFQRWIHNFCIQFYWKTCTRARVRSWTCCVHVIFISNRVCGVARSVEWKRVGCRFKSHYRDIIFLWWEI